MGSATGYLRYYLGNVLTLLGVVGFALGGSWVWLGAATFPLLIAIDLPFGEPDFSERNLRYPLLADVPLYLHVALMTALLVFAARRIGLIVAAGAPSPGQLAGLYALGGWAAAGLMALAFTLSKLLLEGFNYFQHYGLVRVPDSRHGTRHTWSHLTPVVRAVSFEITNHAHHHMDQRVPFHQLRPDPQAPQMPSIVLCFLAALVPPVWFRFIAMPCLRQWDLSFATPEERALAAKANAAAGWPAWLSEGASGSDAALMPSRPA